MIQLTTYELKFSPWQNTLKRRSENKQKKLGNISSNVYACFLYIFQEKHMAPFPLLHTYTIYFIYKVSAWFVFSAVMSVAMWSPGSMHKGITGVLNRLSSCSDSITDLPHSLVNITLAWQI